MAHVAQSTRWRGSDMFTASRVSSSVFAPSFTNITSGLLSIIGFIAPSAVQWFIGDAVLASSSLAANFTPLALASVCSDVTQSGSALICRPSMAFRMASSASPMSPTTGAAIGTLTSISCGSTSSWINFICGFHFPRPNDSIQFSRAPITITTSDFPIIVERHGRALSGPSSGMSPFAIDIGR